ncbi:MAG TPA: DUF6502 family protein [Woeseiaceae bacterium]|nr:DUF6502 family protein [Woeseiaceae bacterium]
MQDKIQKQILDAFFVVLRPIAKILLRYGIGYREFAEVAKSAFVDVATSEYGLRGRPTNASRVAVMTGLTRKEVKRLRENIGLDNETLLKNYNRLSAVLHIWYSDQEFLDSNGNPATLPFSGDSASFSKIVRMVGGDIPPGAVRTELKRLKTIEESQRGYLRPIRRAIAPADEHDNLCLSLLHAAYPLFSNIAHNSECGRNGSTWAQFSAFAKQIDINDLARLRRVCSDRVKESAESFDDLFMAYQKLDDGSESEKEAVPVAVGVFYFEDHSADSEQVWGDK